MTQEEIAVYAAQNGMTPEEWVAHHERRTWSYLETVPTIDVPSLTPKRRLAQPRIKLSLDTKDDLWARIGNTFIWVGPSIFCVEDIREYKSDFWLILTDGKGNRFKAPYKAHELIDLRTPEPQYMSYDDKACFVTRRPDRQFLQGMARSNMFYKQVGQGRLYRFENMWEIIPGLTDTETLMWQTTYWNLLRSRALRSLRLSPAVAFYRAKDGVLLAEYRGRPLGTVQENCVELDEHDFDKPWIRQDLHEIGCTTRKGNKIATSSLEAVEY